MSFRDAIARLALADARRFELQTAAMLREILESCRDEATRAVIREIAAEEDQHARRLQEAAPGAKPPSPPLPAEEQAALPSPPDTAAPDGATCDKLRVLLKKEEASVLFYSLLAERTPIPAVRRVFEQIAAQERGHAARLAGHIRQICQPRRDEENSS